MVDVAEYTTDEAVARDARAWLEENWNPGLPIVEWRKILLDSGWGMPMWPVQWWGKGLSKELARVVAQEFEKVGAWGLVAGGVASGMAAPVILEYGTDELRRRYIPKIFTGEESWCQMFSEPGAGSDVASSQTKAELHGDEWVVNGQKVWTSGADSADNALLLCRTDWDVPKHQGLSYFILPMKQEGIVARPLRQMTGGASFCEVFITDARLPKENQLSTLGNGWSVAITTLMNERVMLGGTDIRVGRQQGMQGSVGDARRRMGRQDSIELAKSLGRNSDLNVRQEIAKLYSLQRIQGFLQQRSRSALVSGKQPGPEASIAKLAGNRIGKASAILNAAITGAGAMLGGSDSPFDGSIVSEQLGYHSGPIGGGTDDIQRNIIGERVLGLPKDIQVDAGVPFRDVKVTVKR